MLGNRLPTGEATELDDRESFVALVSHFGLLDPATEPLPLDDLPAMPALQETERDVVRRKLGPNNRTRRPAVKRGDGA